MGKKAGLQKKKKEGKVDDREAAARRNETELLALQLQLDMRSQELHRAKRDMKIMQEERDEMVRRMEEQKAITQEITSDLTRQYKDMQANLELQIGDLEEENSALLQDISTKQGEMDTILEERNQARAERDKVVGEMKHRMEEMTLEFSNMLRETVETMSLRLDNIPKKERIAPEAKAEILRSRNNSK